jgi:hypothetical protein
LSPGFGFDRFGIFNFLPESFPSSSVTHLPQKGAMRDELFLSPRRTLDLWLFIINSWVHYILNPPATKGKIRWEQATGHPSAESGHDNVSRNPSPKKSKKKF